MRASNRPTRQRGAVLVVALMFLVVLTLLGISSMSTTTLEERMAGNSRSQSLAFQAAEAALRDAERDMMYVWSGAGTPRAIAISGKSGFGNGTADLDNGTCNDGSVVAGVTDWDKYGRGLCRPSASGTMPPLFPTENLAPGSSVAVKYGDYTNATPLIGVAAQPVYVIEALCSGFPPPPGMTLNFTGTQACYHRITSRGFGAGVGGTSNSVVTLQEMFFKPI